MIRVTKTLYSFFTGFRRIGAAGVLPSFSYVKHVNVYLTFVNFKVSRDLICHVVHLSAKPYGFALLINSSLDHNTD